MESKKSFSMLLRELAADYYNHSLSFDEYRQRRRAIFNQIDSHFNGVVAHQGANYTARQSYVNGVDGMTDRVGGGEGKGSHDNNESNDATVPTTLGGTQTFSLQEVLDAQDKKN